MRENRYIVYMLKAQDGRVYIGMTQQSLTQRCRSSAYNGCPSMISAIREFGWDFFEKSVIRENLTKEQAEQAEREFIALYDSTNPNKGFNVALGGNIEGRHAPETLRRMSETQKGREFSPSHIAKMRKPKKGGTLRRTVIQYDLDGVIVREYVSVIEAAKINNAHKESIMRCCNGKQTTAKGYKWRYKEVFG